ncbi:DUF3732 domain-containing protein [Streptomyces sp. NBC_00726]|uniref:DUF3732 domain-containing protein n=1 Tax=Streptomyces sp. NBC_00726 TaxID=2903674 RepID=UPI003868ABE3
MDQRYSPAVAQFNRQVRQPAKLPGYPMLDQSTKPYYPSNMAKARGWPKNLTQDEDRETVSRLLQLMHQVVTEPAPGFQVIVSNHADLPHTRYQASLRHNWHNDEKPIPTT